jgi:VanZ family protein
MLACIMVFGSGVTLELLQNFVPDRDPRFVDAMEKLLGGTAGIVLGRIFQSNFWSTLITGNDRSQRD